MTAPYESFAWLEPPRPEHIILPDMLESMEDRGYWAQFKREGTNAPLWVSPDKEIGSRKRDNTPHKAWQHSELSFEPLKRLNGWGWYYFLNELLHSKVKGGPRNTLYVYDILVHDGVLLTGRTFAERQDILQSMWKPAKTTRGHHEITPTFWVARNHKRRFRKLFDELEDGIDEGLVLKDPKAKLEPCLRPSSNSGWQVKCRRYRKGRSV